MDSQEKKDANSIRHFKGSVKQFKQMLSEKTKAVAETAQSLAGHAIEIAKLNESNLQEAQALSMNSSNGSNVSGSPAFFSPIRTGSRSNTNTTLGNDVDGSPSHWDRYVAGQGQHGGSGT